MNITDNTYPNRVGGNSNINPQSQSVVNSFSIFINVQVVPIQSSGNLLSQPETWWRLHISLVPLFPFPWNTNMLQGSVVLSSQRTLTRSFVRQSLATT